MASFMASPLVRRRHDEGKNGRETQGNCGVNPPVDTGCGQMERVESGRFATKKTIGGICREWSGLSSLLVSACGIRECNPQNFAQKVRIHPADKDMATMTLPMEAVNLALEEYRAYLETLKNIHIYPRFRQKFGMSDIVQITL